MAGENLFLLHSLAMGVFITFVYDLLRIFRRVVPQGPFLVSMEDMAFWVYCGGEVFLLMYHESDGTLRWFAVIGALLGMFLYKKLVSGLFVKYVSLLLNMVLGLLCRPFAWGCRKAGAAGRRTGTKIRRRAGRIKRGIKNRLTYFIKKIKIGIKT